jgi:hypothetical protein
MALPAWLWLVGAALAIAGAYLVGWRAWSSYRRREARDLNEDRYLAWRGRARPAHRPSTTEGMTGEERRRVYLGVGLALFALFCLIGFLTYA